MSFHTVDTNSPSIYENVTIFDDNVYTGTRNFSIQVQGTDGSDGWVEIYIWDDDPGELLYSV